MKTALIEYNPCYPGYTVQQVHEHVQAVIAQKQPEFYKKRHGTRLNITINGKKVAVVELRK